MKQILTIIFFALTATTAWGQEKVGTAVTDSLVYRLAPSVDSSLSGKSIFNIVNAGSGDVKIHQSQAIVDAMKQHIRSNPDRTITGYRVRIFFDNSKTARNESESIQRAFRSAWPGIPVYRNYQNPFFRVAAGDFRTKSEALEFLQKVKGTYPASLVVKEDINFPAADKEHNYTVDTIRVARALQ